MSDREDSRDVFETMCTVTHITGDRKFFEALKSHLGLEYSTFMSGMDLDQEMIHFWTNLSLPDRKEFLECNR